MGKIKLNLTSGTAVEKPLISAFTANDNSYVVLDNEMNGSMGLPIILVCKLENDKLIKIADQNEWQIVKEYLKNIIAGNGAQYISINAEMAADDVYYTQLTLPVASFDALKNAYTMTPQTSEPVVAPVENAVPTETPVVPVEDNPGDTNSEPVMPINNPEPIAPASLGNVEPVVESSPVVEQPEPTNENVEVGPTPINLNMPEPEQATSTPNTFDIPDNNVVNSVPNNIASMDEFKEEKEAFMQACENMFDALVQKFKNK